MKLKSGLLLNKIGEDYVVVASSTDIFKGMLKLNESGAFVFKCLRKGATVGEIVYLICRDYEVEREVAERDVTAFIDTFKKVGLIEE